MTATDPTTGNTQTFSLEEADSADHAAETIRKALANSHPDWVVIAIPNPAKPVGIVALDDGALSVVHYETCPSFEGRSDLELNPRSLGSDDDAGCLNIEVPGRSAVAVLAPHCNRGGGAHNSVRHERSHPGVWHDEGRVVLAPPV